MTSARSHQPHTQLTCPWVSGVGPPKPALWRLDADGGVASCSVNLSAIIRRQSQQSLNPTRRRCKSYQRSGVEIGSVLSDGQVFTEKWWSTPPRHRRSRVTRVRGRVHTKTADAYAPRSGRSPCQSTVALPPALRADPLRGGFGGFAPQCRAGRRRASVSSSCPVLHLMTLHP